MPDFDQRINVGFVGTAQSGKHSLWRKYCERYNNIDKNLISESHEAVAFHAISSFKIQHESFKTERNLNLYALSNNPKFITISRSYYCQLDIINVCVAKDNLEHNNLEQLEEELKEIQQEIAKEAKPRALTFIVTQADDEKYISDAAEERLNILYKTVNEIFKSQVEVIEPAIITSATAWNDAMDHAITKRIEASTLSILCRSDNHSFTHPIQTFSKSSIVNSPSIKTSLYSAGFFTGSTAITGSLAFFLNSAISGDALSGLTITSVATGGLAFACVLLTCFMLYQYQQSYQPLSTADDYESPTITS